MAFPSVRLFVNRATALVSGFRVTDDDATTLAQLCNKLDGLPLAIELAAARIDSFDIQTLTLELENCLEILTRGRRTAQERHRTLRATLDWSFRLLTESEQLLLARLGVFRSAFTRDAALEIASHGSLRVEEALDGLTNLAAKSLLVVSSDGAAPLYRLLDSTRAYASEKLGDGIEGNEIRRLHAHYLKVRIEQLDPRATPVLPSHRSVFSRTVDEMRAAIAWSFSSVGDPALGTQLISSSSYMWSELSLFEEYKRYADKALSVIKRSPDGIREELRLLNVTGPAIYETLGSVPELYATATRALELAAQLGDQSVMTGGLHSLWRYHHGRGEYQKSLEAAEQIQQCLAANSPNELWWKPLKALSLLYMGRLYESRSLLAEIDGKIPVSDLGVTCYDYNVSVIVNGALARILWLQGMSDSASLCADACVDSAIKAGQSVGICFALTIAGCPISFWKRDLTTLERYIAMLQDHAVQSRSLYWSQYVQVFQIGLSASRDPSQASILLADAQTSRWDYRHWENFSVLGEGFAPRSLVERATSDPAWWCSSEVIRLEAVRVARDGGVNAHPAQRTLLCTALDIAQQQKALAWELRVAKSIVETSSTASEIQEARQLLANTLSDFTEGFASLDFHEAEKLLESTSRFR